MPPAQDSDDDENKNHTPRSSSAVGEIPPKLDVTNAVIDASDTDDDSLQEDRLKAQMVGDLVDPEFKRRLDKLQDRLHNQTLPHMPTASSSSTSSSSSSPSTSASD